MSTRRPAARFALGVVVTIGLFACAELALRLVRGPVPPPPLVRQMWDPGSVPFTVSGAQVEATYQERDLVGPFPAEPSAGVPRVMVFGESSVRGGSYLPAEQEFPALLQARITAAGTPVEVLNLGRVAMDSHSIRVVAEAAVAFRPQVAVFYNGHNDIGNAYFLARYSSVSSANAAHLRAFFQRFQLYAALRDAVMPAAQAGGPGAGPPVSARPTDAQRAVAEQEYGANLELAVRAMQAAGAKVLLVTPISRDGVYEAQEGVCPELVAPSAWRPAQSGWVLLPRLVGPEVAATAAEAAPSCPEARYVRGWWRQAQADFAGGWADLHAARDLDPRPVRASEGILEAMRAVSARTGAGLVDLARDNEALHAPTTDAWFIDQVHFSAAGHEQVAEAVQPALTALLGG